MENIIVIREDRERRRRERRQSGLGPFPYPDVNADNQLAHPRYSMQYLREFDEWLSDWVPESEEDEFREVELLLEQEAPQVLEYRDEDLDAAFHALVDILNGDDLDDEGYNSA